MDLIQPYHAELNIPDSLKSWLIGFSNIDTNEYEFILRDLPFMKVRIRASKVKKTAKFFAEANYKIKVLESHDRYIVPNGISDKPEDAILNCLAKVINKGRVFEAKMNKAYSGTPVTG